MTTAATKATKPPAPPSGSGKRAAALWRDVLATWELDAPALALLEELVSAIDRVDQARAVLKSEGLTVTDRYGQTKPHPAASIENAASGRVRALLGALALPADEDAEGLSPREQYRRRRFSR